VVTGPHLLPLDRSNPRTVLDDIRGVGDWGDPDIMHQKVGYVNYFLSFELLPDNDIPITSSSHVC